MPYFAEAKQASEEMSQSKHTPGPWKAHLAREVQSSLYKTNVHHHDPEKYVMPAAGYGPSREVAEANARLVAAAPELLAACNRAFHVFENDTPRKQEVLEQIRLAIVKATTA